mmetsp:Transcript_18113/g.31266  ORF Transcript_18113/g.31266 Transcript_18113/m.31266 type:complete len:402 (-) Transcript_18113:751-1956(-)
MDQHLAFVVPVAHKTVSARRVSSLFEFSSPPATRNFDALQLKRNTSISISKRKVFFGTSVEGESSSGQLVVGVRRFVTAVTSSVQQQTTLEPPSSTSVSASPSRLDVLKTSSSIRTSQDTSRETSVGVAGKKIPSAISSVWQTPRLRRSRLSRSEDDDSDDFDRYSMPLVRSSISQAQIQNDRLNRITNDILPSPKQDSNVGQCGGLAAFRKFLEQYHNAMDEVQKQQAAAAATAAEMRKAGHTVRGSPEWRKKISMARRGQLVGKKAPFYGKTHSPEVRMRISLAMQKRMRGKNHFMFGKGHSDETKEKIRKAKLRKALSPQTRRKISQTMKNYWRMKDLPTPERHVNEPWLKEAAAQALSALEDYLEEKEKAEDEFEVEQQVNQRKIWLKAERKFHILD